MFWASSLISSLFSVSPQTSFWEAFVWIRFPLFVVASIYLFSNRRSVIMLYLATLFIGSLAMGIISISELLYFLEWVTVEAQGQLTFSSDRGDGRLMWPYGDYYPGSYHSKVVMPLFLISIYFALNGLRGKYFSYAFLLFSCFSCAITGERVHTLLKGINIFFALLFMPKRLSYVIGLMISGIALLLVYFVLHPYAVQRYAQIIFELLSPSTSNYFLLVTGALTVFKENIFFGIGVDNYLTSCSSLQVNGLICNVHPHNYFLQILAETGLVGFSLASLMFFYLTKYCWAIYTQSPKEIGATVALITLITVFFPIQTTGDFFGQWNNLCIWAAIAMGIMVSNVKLSNQTKGI